MLLTRLGLQVTGRTAPIETLYQKELDLQHE
jgi:hypothetical protein